MVVLRNFPGYFLGYFLVSAICLAAVPVHGHQMGRSVPIGHSPSGPVHFAAQVIASYFEEQMGREVKLVGTGVDLESIKLIGEKEFPMAVVEASGANDLPNGVTRLEGVFGPSGQTVVLLIGSEARNKLEFSLVQRYLDKLSEKLSTTDWESAMTRVQAGEGIRGVALDMLRERDLL